MNEKLTRRSFLGRSALAAAPTGTLSHAAEAPSQAAPRQVTPGSKGSH